MGVNLKSKILLVIILVITALACTSRKSKIDRTELIPKEKLREILVDLYLTDGLLTIPVVHKWYSSSDTIGAYKDVIQGYGYTKEQFDRTMRFYMIRKPKEIIKIYDQALAKLSEMQARAEEDSQQLLAKSSNLWKGETYFYSPGAGTDSTDFEMTLPVWNLYHLNITITVFPDDQSYNPRFTGFTCDKDSVETGKRYYIPSIKYIKDGLPHTYKIVINDPVRSHHHFRGRLFDYGNKPGTFCKHFIIEDVQLSYGQI